MELLTSPAARTNEVYPTRPLYKFATDANGRFPSGLTITTPETGAWKWRLHMPDRQRLDAYIEQGDGSAIEIDDWITLSGAAGNEAGTPEMEWLRGLRTAVAGADDGQMLAVDGGTLEIVDPPEGMPEPESDGIWARFLASGVGSWLKATTIGAAVFAAVSEAAARLAIGAAASAGSGTAGDLMISDASGNAVRAGYGPSAFDAAGAAAAAQAASLQKASNLSDLASADTARVNLKAARLEGRHTIVLLGDSITEANNEEGRNVGYFAWANAMLGARFIVTNYAGVGGNVTAQMLARLQTDVIAYAPEFCLVMGGANDTGGGTASSTTIANLQAIYEQLYAEGIRVIACTVNPTTSINTAVKRDAWYAVRDWQLAYARSNPIILIDTAAMYTDASLGWPHPVTGTTWDGVHPTALGAGRMGKAIADALREHVIPLPKLPLENDGDYMITPNPLMLGTGGMASGTATGTVATHWQASAGTFSKVARTDFLPGEWQEMEPGGTGQALFYHNLFPYLFGFNVGDYVYAVVEIETDDDWVGASALRAEVKFRTSAGVLIDFVGALASSPNSGSSIINPGACILRTDSFPIPANTGQIELLVTFAATAGTVRIGRVGIVNPDLTYSKIADTGANALRAKLMSGVTLNSGYASFDGSYFSVGDLWSYALASNFNGKETTLIVRGRIAASDTGTAAGRVFVYLQASSQNFIRIYKSGANTVTFSYDTSSQAPVTKTHTPTGDTWYTYGITASRTAGEMKAYVDGSQQGTTGSISTDFVGPLLKGSTVAGGAGYVTNAGLIGDIADVIIGLTGSTIPSAANMATIHTGLAAGTLTAGALNTIFGSGKWAWWKLSA